MTVKEMRELLEVIEKDGAGDCSLVDAQDNEICSIIKDYTENPSLIWVTTTSPKF